MGLIVDTDCKKTPEYSQHRTSTPESRTHVAQLLLPEQRSWSTSLCWSMGWMYCFTAGTFWSVRVAGGTAGAAAYCVACVEGGGASAWSVLGRCCPGGGGAGGASCVVLVSSFPICEAAGRVIWRCARSWSLDACALCGSCWPVLLYGFWVGVRGSGCECGLPAAYSCCWVASRGMLGVGEAPDALAVVVSARLGVGVDSAFAGVPAALQEL